MNTLKVLKINHIKNLLTIVNVCVQSDKGYEIILFKLHEAYTYIIETNLIESSIVNIFTGINQKLHEMILNMTNKVRTVPENWEEIINQLFETLINSNTNNNALNENIQLYLVN